jgi:hypothetical protein
MTKREQIIELIQKYMFHQNINDEQELADAILALPIDVPTEEEMDEEILDLNIKERPEYTPEGDYRYFLLWDFAKWAINEIIKRNK